MISLACRPKKFGKFSKNMEEKIEIYDFSKVLLCAPPSPSVQFTLGAPLLPGSRYAPE